MKASKNRNTNKQGMNKKLLNSPPQCYTDLVDEDNATETQAEIKQHCLGFDKQQQEQRKRIFAVLHVKVKAKARERKTQTGELEPGQ